MLRAVGGKSEFYAHWHTTPLGCVVLAFLLCGCLPTAACGDDRDSVVPKPAWMHLYAQDRRQKHALESAEILAKESQWQAVVPKLQYILHQPRDAWIPLPTGEIASIRRQALRLLDDDASPLLRVYQEMVGPDAKLELARARDADTSSAYLGVVRRFFATPEAFEATEWLLKHWLDDGDWQRAAALSVRIIESPSHRRDLHPRFLKMALLACDLAGRTADADVIRERLSQLASLQPRTRHADVPTPAVIAPPPAVAPSPPVLEPDWTQPLESAGAYPQLNRVLSEWAAGQREQDEPTAVGWAPIRAGQRIVFRDLDTIRAVDIQSGETAWRYRTSSGLGELLNPSDQDGVRRRFRSAMWDAASANSLVSGLSTDGQRVYAVDDTEEMLLVGIYGLDSGQLPQTSRRHAARNQLIALNLWSEGHGSRLAWSSADSLDKDRLENHAFLGPPLVAHGMLYAISEHDREVCVTSLQASTGRVLWQQPIAEAERSVVEEKGRISRACIPVQAQDLIVCPTHIGLLVAVDAVTGELRWVHESLESVPEAAASRFRNLSTLTQRRHAAFPCTPVLAGDAIVYLPSQADKLYCLDAATGQPRWSVKADQVEYIATVSDKCIVLLGKAGAQACSLETGESLWLSPLSSVVSGYGVDIPGGYLVPLESGQVVNLDLETGQPRGFRFDAEPLPVGHLVATADLVVSVGAHGVSAFPQSHTVLARLSKPGTPAGTSLASLKVAEVRLAEGNLNAAIEALESTWRVVPDGADRRRTRRLLWEAYFQLLKEEPDRTDYCLGQLERLTEKSSPQELARWLIAVTARAEAHHDQQQLLTHFLQLATASNDGGLFECPTDRHLELSSVAWLNLLFQELKDEPLRKELQQRLLVLADAGSLDAAAKVSERILDDSILGQVRLQQAESCSSRNSWQDAVVLLQRMQSGAASQTVAASELALAQLLTRAGLHASAGQALTRFQHAAGLLAPELDPTRYLGKTIAAAHTADAWRRTQPAHWQIDTVRIHSRPRQDFNVGDLGPARGRARHFDPLEDYQRQILPAADSPLEWMLRNGERGTEVGIFDKLSSKKLVEEVLPFGASPPFSIGNLFHGTLVPFSYPGEVRALSLLEGRKDHVAWTLKLPEWTNRSGQALCGPSTAHVLLFQWKNTLFAVDPLDGRVLWRRNDLEPTSGLYADTRIGLLADDDIVFILGSDKTAYRVLRTSTGEVLRRGALKQDARFNRSPLGRMVLHISDEGDQKFIRLWDPKTDELLLDDPLRTRQLYAAFSDDAVVWLTPDARLRVYSVAARAIVVDVSIDSEEAAGPGTTASTIRAFTQNGWYYLSLGRNQPGVSTTHVHMPVQDKLIAETNMRDDLFAIGPDGRTIRWHKMISQRSFLQFGDAPMPVLVSAALVRDKRDQNRRWLRVEAIDPQTGEILGMADELPNDRLLHVDYDGAAGRLQILGRNTVIDLDFSPTAQRRWPVTDPL